MKYKYKYRQQQSKLSCLTEQRGKAKHKTMLFSEALYLHISRLPENRDRAFLEYLYEHAQGRANAKPWAVIEAHLIKKGLKVGHRSIQQGILQKTREGESFIGVNDRAPYKGYFVILDKEDYLLTREWYNRRIQRLQKNQTNLVKLGAQMGFEK